MKLPKIFHRGKFFTDQNGFTLFEILIAMAILAVLAGLGMFLSFDFYRGYAFRYERNILVSIMQKGRSMAMNNINESAHGVHIGSNAYILFQGGSFDSADPLNIEIPISNGMTLGGSNEILFQQLSGDVPAPGSITLTNGVQTATISVNDEGSINW